jgi:hypothetical protein
MTDPSPPGAAFLASVDPLSPFPSTGIRFFDLLSICDGVDIGLHGLDLDALCVLRGMCTAVHATVDRFPVQVVENIPLLQLDRRRACFPAAATWDLSRNIGESYLDDDPVWESQPYLHCRTLDISGNFLSGAVFAFFPNLHTLRMAGCDGISEDAVARLSDLQALDISECRHISAAVLVRWPLLRELGVMRCAQMTDSALSLLHNLRKLNISFCPQLTDAALSAKPLLADLNVQQCPGITDDGLTRFPNLRKLNISGCERLTDAALSAMPLLADLNVSRCSGITDDGLSQLPHLCKLDIASCDHLSGRTLPASAAARTRYVAMP